MGAKAVDQDMVTTIIFRKKILIIQARLPPKPIADLDFLTFLLCLIIVYILKPKTLEKYQVCQGYRPRNGDYFDFKGPE
jgi:hypothetical protein